MKPDIFFSHSFMTTPTLTIRGKVPLLYQKVVSIMLMVSHADHSGQSALLIPEGLCR